MKFSFVARCRARRIRLLVASVILATVAVAGSDASPVSAAGTSFYVDCVNGKDGAAGSAAAPWKSLTRASDATLQPGDQLLLARGCVWDGQRLDVPWNGTAAAQITITGYGNGAKPIIKNGANSNVKVTGSYVVLDGLESKNNPRQLDPCGQPLGTYYGFNFAGGAHHNTLINSASSGSTAGAATSAPPRVRHAVLSNVFSGNNVLEQFGTNNDLGAWGVNIISDDNEVAYNLFYDNAAVSHEWQRREQLGRFFEGSNNNIHDNELVQRPSVLRARQQRIRQGRQQHVHQQPLRHRPSLLPVHRDPRSR